MTPDDMVSAAFEAAEEALAAGELPIGAVVVLDGEVIGRAYTQERSRGRRLVHADLLAMAQADERLGLGQPPYSLQLAVTLEPCLMCLGAAMTLGVTEIYFSLESPADGSAGVAAGWQPSPETPWYRAPMMTGGIRREDSRELLRRYCRTAPEGGFRRWAQTLADPIIG
jgi:tRNA(adenine34) deaminase